MRNREGMSRLVWVLEADAPGLIVGPMGAYYSTIKYRHNGIEYEVLMENEDFELIEDDEFDND